MSQSDRELLEMAAKAAEYGVVYCSWHGRFSGNVSGFRFGDSIGQIWNPIEDDGDALRLSVILKMTIDVDLWRNEVRVRAYKDGCGMHHIAESSADLFTATRIAIVRAAAEIGRSMP